VKGNIDLEIGFLDKSYAKLKMTILIAWAILFIVSGNLLFCGALNIQNTRIIFEVIITERK